MPEASQGAEAATGRTGGESLVSGAVWVNLDQRGCRPKTNEAEDKNSCAHRITRRLGSRPGAGTGSRVVR
jgi:hypothetical protein